MIVEKKHLSNLKRAVFSITIFLFSVFPAEAQSADPNFPTPVTTNQVNGTIKARDLGDSRLTTYFYVFGGGQGDIFVNVVTKNFDGDIDIFTLNSLKPLTKIRVFSDSSDNETGRIVYLRQPEKLLLRIEGRTPNDEPATFQIKFAGSFIAEKPSNQSNKTPEVKNSNQGGVRVNSVGTIVETPSRPTPKAETPAAEKAKPEIKETKSEEKTEIAGKKEEATNTPPKATKPKIEVVISDIFAEPMIEEKTEEKTDEKTEEKTEEKTSEKTEEPQKNEINLNNETSEAAKESNPLEKIKLVLVFKDGTRIERPMSEILNVNIDKGVLTVTGKDGTIGRYSILDIVEMTIK